MSTSATSKLRFLPPNTKSVLQPLDQGVICALKAGYRKCLVQWLLANLRTRRKLKTDQENQLQIAFVIVDSISGEAAASLSDNNDGPLKKLDLLSQLSEFPGAVCGGTAAADFMYVDDDVVTSRELVDKSNCEDSMSSDPPTCSNALHTLSLLCCHCASREGCWITCTEALDKIKKNVSKMKKQKKIRDYFSH